MNTKQLLSMTAQFYNVMGRDLIVVEEGVGNYKVMTFYNALMDGDTTVIQNTDALTALSFDLNLLPRTGQGVIGNRYNNNVVYLDGHNEDLETTKTIAVYSLAMIIEGPHELVPATSKFSLKYLQFIRWSCLNKFEKQERLKQARAVLAEAETGRFNWRKDHDETRHI